MTIEPWPFFICSGGQDHYDAWATKLQEDPWRKFKHLVSMALAEVNLPGVVWIKHGPGHLCVWNHATTSPTYIEEMAWYSRNYKAYWDYVERAIGIALAQSPEVTSQYSFYITRPVENTRVPPNTVNFNMGVK